ncbi:hypothetical protein ACIQVK_21710 [Streptomyces sp. NPDC090493]|uniref:hypothetical protein n=1 Tax=Streptomyces sp. NPDC090493 TaxID=3365964 RepID=UPI003814890E
MATNTGKGFRRGSASRRSQVLNPRTGTWTKRDDKGRFMGGKAGGASFKGIRREE